MKRSVQESTFQRECPPVNFGLFYRFEKKFNANHLKLYFCAFMALFSQSSPIKAFSQILILIGLCILGLFIFSLGGIYLCSFVYNLSFSEIQTLTLYPEANPNSRIILLIIQGFSAVGSFIVAPYLLYLFSKPNDLEPSEPKFSSLILFGLVFVIAFLMMPVNAWLAAWNESIHLPDFLNPLQDWALEKEKSLEKLTAYLVDFQTKSETILGFAVVALLAGISEEFFFRKLLQVRIITLVRNPHVGIWLTAFIFAAIHVQFYGLIPRMILGALFGYYFYWTGNIALAMFGHILNNGITLIGVILYQQKLSPIDVEDPEQIPWYLGAVAAGITWSLVVMFKEEADKQARKVGLPTPNSALV